MDLVDQEDHAWEALSGPWWVCVIMMMVWSGWDKNDVARTGCGGPGTVLLILE